MSRIAMAGMVQRGRRIVLALSLALMAACGGLPETTHGYAPTDDELSDIVVGLDTRQTVASIIGPPRAAGVLSDGGWYYVQSKVQQRGLFSPAEIDRQVVAISFTDKGVVQNIERFGLERGQVVVLSRRVTDSNIKDVSFLRQLMGNFGRVTADQFLGPG